MAVTTNYSLPLITSSEYSSKLFREFVALMCGNDNTSALNIIDGILHAKANLVNGKIPASELPSFVDDIVNGYLYNGVLYATKTSTTYSDAITGEDGKIYVDLDTNLSYRWNGSAFIRVNETDLTNYYTKTQVDSLVAKLVFTNVSASTWVSDSTYTGYSYKCDLTCTGITANSIVEVIFGVTEAISGNYAPVCVTGADTVTIYSKVNTSITIPTIKEL